MSKYEINISFDVLKAVAVIAADYDVREYLMCVAIVGEMVVATDGHKLLAVPNAINGNSSGWGDDHTILIPKAAIEELGKIYRKRKAIRHTVVRIVGEHGTNHCEIIDGEGDTAHVFPVKLCELRFPDWKRAVRKYNYAVSECDPVVRINWSYMVEFAKAGRLLGKSKFWYPSFHISKCNESVNINMEYDGAIATVMPMRG